MSQIVVFMLSHFMLIASLNAQEQRILPIQYDFPTLGIVAINGSSSTGGCSSVGAPNLDATSTCMTPASSALFDGEIPILSGLNSNSWADEQMVMGRPEFGPASFVINSYISYTSVGRAEITLFNCPQWRIGVSYISAFYSSSSSRSTSYNHLHRVSLTTFSCDSLVTVCIPLSVSARQIRLSFSGSSGIHIAEIAFYASSSPCPLYTLIPGNWTAPNATEMVTEPENSTSDDSLSASGAVLGESLKKAARPLVSILSILATIITLQIVLFFIVGLIVACKFCRKEQKRTKTYPEKRQECPEEQPQPSPKELEKNEEEEDEVYEMMDDQPEKPVKPPKPPVRKKKVHYMNVNYGSQKYMAS